MKRFTFKSQLTLAIGFAVALMGSTYLTGCGKSGGSNSPAPTNVTPTNFTGGRIGFFAQNDKMDSLFLDGGSTFILKESYKNVLKTAMRTCDRAYHSGGLADCKAWLNGLNDIMIFADNEQSSTVQMVVRSLVDSSCTNPYYCSQYWYSMPSFKQVLLGLFGVDSTNYSYVYNPMVLNMTIWPVNASKGFELRGYAPGNDLYYGSGALLFQFIVREGKLSDPTWTFELFFNGESVASGRMVRCTTQNCGVNGY